MEIDKATIAKGLHSCWFKKPRTTEDIKTGVACKTAAKEANKLHPLFTCQWTNEPGNLLRLGNDNNIYLGSSIVKRPGKTKSCGLKLKRMTASDASKVKGTRVYPGLYII